MIEIKLESFSKEDWKMLEGDDIIEYNDYGLGFRLESPDWPCYSKPSPGSILKGKLLDNIDLPRSFTVVRSESSILEKIQFDVNPYTREVYITYSNPGGKDIYQGDILFTIFF